MYKLKLDKYNQRFIVRYKVPLINIYNITSTKIVNTQYLKNLDILVVNFGLHSKLNKIILTSITNDKMYNILQFF